MRYSDPIYGEVDIEEPALLHLMETQAMQRLRGVLQHGITALIGITRPVTRFDHSVGVMLLVRRLGGSLEEQIAALLHDVVTRPSVTSLITWSMDMTARATTKSGKKRTCSPVTCRKF